MEVIRFFQQNKVRVFDDKTYNVDNLNNYDTIYASRDCTVNDSASCHGVQLFRGEKISKSVLLLGEGGSTCVHEAGVLIDDNIILVCCGDGVFCLSLPDLNLLWFTQADTATCFEIYKYAENYIIHGELEISRITKQGKLVWQFSGSDIFTTISGKNAFAILGNKVFATSWDDRKYELDIDTGILIE